MNKWQRFFDSLEENDKKSGTTTTTKSAFSSQKISSKYQFHPKPTLVVGRRVAIARAVMAADKQKATESACVLAGRVENGVVYADEPLFFPQERSASFVEFDESHDLAANFWLAVNEYLEQNDKVLVGWMHQWTGGVHHSQTDYDTDAQFFEKMRDKCPMFVSATFNAKEFGAEGLAVVSLGEGEVDVTVPEYRIVWERDDDIISEIVEATTENLELTIGADLFGKRFSYRVDTLQVPVPEDDLRAAITAHVKENFDTYIEQSDTLEQVMATGFATKEELEEFDEMLDAVSTIKATKAAGKGTSYGSRVGSGKSSGSLTKHGASQYPSEERVNIAAVIWEDVLLNNSFTLTTVNIRDEVKKHHNIETTHGTIGNVIEMFKVARVFKNTAGARPGLNSEFNATEFVDDLIDAMLGRNEDWSESEQIRTTFNKISGHSTIIGREVFDGLLVAMTSFVGSPVISEGSKYSLLMREIPANALDTIKDLEKQWSVVPDVN